MATHFAPDTLTGATSVQAHITDDVQTLLTFVQNTHQYTCATNRRCSLCDTVARVRASLVPPQRGVA